MKNEKKRDWRVILQGAIGIEFAFCGFGVGKNLFHVYARLGVLTIYVSAKRLDQLVALYRDVLSKAKERG
jgi:hypothetical protein